MSHISLLKQEKGSTVIVFLFIMSMLAALAVGALQVTSLNVESSRGLLKGKQSYYAAEVGMDTASNAVVNSFENLIPFTGSNGFVAIPNYRGFSVQYSVTLAQPQFLYQTVKGQDILNHWAYTYNVVSTATSLTDNSTETLRETIRILETPLVQWFIFYGGAGAPGGAPDLELHSGTNWTSWGRVHTNGNFHIGTTSGAPNSFHRFQNFDPAGPVQTPHAITVAGSIFPQKKQGAAVSRSGDVKTTNLAPVWQNSLPINVPINTANEVVQEGNFNNFIQVNEQQQLTPGPVVFARNGFYEQAARNPLLPGVDGITVIGQGPLGAGTTVTVSRPAPNTDVTALIAAGQTSPGVPFLGPVPIIQERLNDFQDCREGNRNVSTMDIDLWALQSWYQAYLADPVNGGGVLGAGGMLIYASRSPNAAFTNLANPMQSIRLKEIGGGSSAQLLSNTTFATDNPLYVEGDFNNQGTRMGTVIIADAIHVLSNGWAGKACPGAPPTGTVATSVNAAFFSGNAPTVIGGAYGGGVHNYPRFLENWQARNFNYRGAFINLFPSAQANGNWCLGGCYSAPTRNWGWDVNFQNPNYWPPYIPSVYEAERVGFLD